MFCFFPIRPLYSSKRELNVFKYWLNGNLGCGFTHFTNQLKNRGFLSALLTVNRFIFARFSVLFFAIFVIVFALSSSAVRENFHEDKATHLIMAIVRYKPKDGGIHGSNYVLPRSNHCKGRFFFASK